MYRQKLGEYGKHRRNIEKHRKHRRNKLVGGAAVKTKLMDVLQGYFFFNNDLYDVKYILNVIRCQPCI